MPNLATASALTRDASMGPGRLTGMNDRASWLRTMRPLRFNGARSIDRDERRLRFEKAYVQHTASMGPGRLTGMNEQEVGQNADRRRGASMGPGRLTGMNARSPPRAAPAARRFNGARSIDRDERYPPATVGAAATMGFNGARSIDRDERGVRVA